MSQEQPIRASVAYDAEAVEVPARAYEVLYNPLTDSFIVMDRDGRTDELNRQFQ